MTDIAQTAQDLQSEAMLANNAYEALVKTALWALLPHGEVEEVEVLGASYPRVKQVLFPEPAQARMNEVVKRADVEVGDLVTVYELRKLKGGYLRTYRDTTSVREYAQQRNYSLGLVVKVGPKTMEIRTLSFPWVHGAGDTFGLRDDRPADQWVSRYSYGAECREVMRLGRYDEILAAYNAAVSGPEIAAAKQARDEAWAAYEAAAELAQAAQQDRWAPFQAKAEALNKAVGTRVANAPLYGEPRLDLSVDTELVRLAIFGRLHLGQIDKDLASQAVKALWLPLQGR